MMLKNHSSWLEVMLDFAVLNKNPRTDIKFFSVLIINNFPRFPFTHKPGSNNLYIVSTGVFMIRGNMHTQSVHKT